VSRPHRHWWWRAWQKRPSDGRVAAASVGIVHLVQEGPAHSRFQRPATGARVPVASVAIEWVNISRRSTSTAAATDGEFERVIGVGMRCVWRGLDDHVVAVDDVAIARRPERSPQRRPRTLSRNFERPRSRLDDGPTS
jgi:hypothetical protein